MINIEKKRTLEADISCLKNQISELQEELLKKERELWWLKRPHIDRFDNEYYMESDDEGGGYAVWRPDCVHLNNKWLSQEGNKELVDKALVYLEQEGYSDEYLICGLEDDTEPYFGDDPYPGFHDWELKTVRNPNYV